MSTTNPTVSTKVVLRPIDIDDTHLIVAWRNDPAVRGNLISQDSISESDHMAWLEREVFAGRCAQFIVCLSDGCQDVPVGTTFIKNIDCNEGCGEFGIILGEKNARGKGYSSEAMRLILEYAFETLDLSMIYLTVFADNIPGIRTYEKMGFVTDEAKTEIIDRDHGDGRLLYMSLERDEYRLR